MHVCAVCVCMCAWHVRVCLFCHVLANKCAPANCTCMCAHKPVLKCACFNKYVNVRECVSTYNIAVYNMYHSMISVWWYLSTRELLLIGVPVACNHRETKIKLVWLLVFPVVTTTDTNLISFPVVANNWEQLDVIAEHPAEDHLAWGSACDGEAVQGQSSPKEDSGICERSWCFRLAMLIEQEELYQYISCLQLQRQKESSWCQWLWPKGYAGVSGCDHRDLKSNEAGAVTELLATTGK